MKGAQVNLAKAVRVVGLHLLFWIIVVSYFAWGFGLDTVSPRIALTNALFYLPGHVIMVYGLLYFLVPRYLLPRKFWQFFLGLILLTLICATYAFLAQLSVNGMDKYAGVNVRTGRNVLPFIHVGAIAASVKLLKYWYFQRKQTIQAEQQRTVAELQLLKAQLHPHFLFNTLNNLYSHTLEYSPKSPEIVLKLSALLRFMIYESNVPRISLAKEFELLQHYITLEQLRYGDRLDLSVNLDGEIEKYQIAPLLLLPFLENAFKHGTSKQIDQCWISLDLAVVENTLYFKLINSIDTHTEENATGGKGVGLQNVARRLQLLYKNKYEFNTNRLEEVFVVNLTLELENLEARYTEEQQFSQKEHINDL